MAQEIGVGCSICDLPNCSARDDKQRQHEKAPEASTPVNEAVPAGQEQSPSITGKLPHPKSSQGSISEQNFPSVSDDYFIPKGGKFVRLSSIRAAFTSVKSSGLTTKSGSLGSDGKRSIASRTGAATGSRGQKKSLFAKLFQRRKKAAEPHSLSRPGSAATITRCDSGNEAGSDSDSFRLKRSVKPGSPNSDSEWLPVEDDKMKSGRKSSFFKRNRKHIIGGIVVGIILLVSIVVGVTIYVSLKTAGPGRPKEDIQNGTKPMTATQGITEKQATVGTDEQTGTTSSRTENTSSVTSIIVDLSTKTTSQSAIVDTSSSIRTSIGTSASTTVNTSVSVTVNASTITSTVSTTDVQNSSDTSTPSWVSTTIIKPTVTTTSTATDGSTTSTTAETEPSENGTDAMLLYDSIQALLSQRRGSLERNESSHDAGRMQREDE